MKRKNSIRIPKSLSAMARKHGIPAPRLARKVLLNFARQNIASIVIK